MCCVGWGENCGVVGCTVFVGAADYVVGLGGGCYGERVDDDVGLEED